MTPVQDAKEKLRELFENMDFSLLMPIFNNANLDQKEKSKIIEELNNQIFNKLNAACPYCCWHQEFAPGSVWLNGKEEIVDDRVDIFGCYPFFRVVIEIDATRADQVAKKALSRIAYFGADRLLYVAFCYQGPSGSNAKECEKYFKIIEHTLKTFNPDSEFLGVIIDKPQYRLRFFN